MHFVHNIITVSKRHISHLFENFVTALTQPYRDYVLGRLIKGRRVLILGSGPTATELQSIPRDVCVLTCNRGPEVLLQKGFLHIDLYISNIRIVHEKDHRERLLSLLTLFDINVFLFRRPQFVRKHLDIKNYRFLLKDRSVGGRDHFYLQRLIRPHTIADVTGTSKKHSTTTGIGLLLYALYYKASEIYLAGIDLDGTPPPSTTKKRYTEIYMSSHKDMDYNVMHILAQKYKHIFVTSKNTPLHSLFSFRELK